MATHRTNACSNAPCESALLRDIAWFRDRIDEADANADAEAVYRPFIERRLQLLRALRDGHASRWRDYPAGESRVRRSPAFRRLALALVATSVLAACAPPRAGGPSPAHGFETAGVGIGQLILSPFLIAAGLLEGIATLPYFIAADLHELNQGMVQSGAQVDVDRTYRYAYQRELDRVPADGDTGAVFRHMSEATRHFQRVLMGYGVTNYNEYVLTAVRTADRDGYTLYAVVHRPVGPISVRDARSGHSVELDPGDRDYYRPHERDASGQPLDVIIDWAGVPRTSIRTQKGQAILMTIAANSVLTNRRSDEYWSAETHWRAGGFRQIVAERDGYLKQRMGLQG